jgi:hypothetical protein
VSLTNKSGFLATTAGGGGDIAINARNVNFSGESSIQAGIGRRLGVSGSKAGNIILNATGDLIVDESSEISNSIFPEGDGSSGNINIQAKSVFLNDGGQISALVYGKGNSGNIEVTALDTISISDQQKKSSRGITNSISSKAIGNSGNITINTKKLIIQYSNISLSAFGSGNTGNLIVRATDSISLKGDSHRSDGTG